MSDATNDALFAEEPDQATTVLEEAFQTYSDAGLRLPPVPLDMTESLDELSGDWHFGTADLPLTDRADFLAAAADPATPPQLGFGHMGHGVSSWWLCYRLIRGPLALFVRQSYGGVYDDEESSRAAVNNLVPDLEELIVGADLAQKSGRIAKGQRLIVVVDDLEGGYWQIGDGAPTPETGIDAVTAALAFLNSAQG
jgi:hypothetical protein